MGREIKHKELGQYLRDHRERLGYSLRQVAKLVGVDFTYLGKLEQGYYRHPNPEHLHALARVLEVDPEELLTVAAYDSRDDVPSVGPYLRAKHPNVPPEVLAQIAEYAEFLTARHGEEGGSHGRDSRAA